MQLAQTSSAADILDSGYSAGAGMPRSTGAAHIGVSSTFPLCVEEISLGFYGLLSVSRPAQQQAVALKSQVTNFNLLTIAQHPLCSLTPPARREQAALRDARCSFGITREPSPLRHSSPCLHPALAPYLGLGRRESSPNPALSTGVSLKSASSPWGGVCVAEGLSGAGNSDARGRHGFG